MATISTKHQVGNFTETEELILHLLDGARRHQRLGPAIGQPSKQMQISVRERRRCASRPRGHSSSYFGTIAPYAALSRPLRIFGQPPTWW